jgi:tetratricopeptide (TPR) repeat protein
MIKKGLLPLITFLLGMLSPIAISAQTGQQQARTLFEQGQTALNMQDFYTATVYLKEAIAINPNYSDALFAMAEVYFFLEAYREALTLLDEVDRLGSSVRARTLRGRTLAVLGQVSEAEMIFRIVLQGEPNNIDALFGMAEVLLLQGKHDQAIRQIEDLLRLYPDNRRGLLSLALIFTNMKEYVRAQRYMDQAVYYFPHDPLVRFNAGLHFEQREMWSRALEHYQATYVINPQYNGLAERRAAVLLGTGQYAQTIAILEELIRGRGRTDPNVWSTLASTFTQMGDLKQAFTTHQEVLRLQPYDELNRLSAEDFVMNSFPIGSTEREELSRFRYQEGVRFQRSLQNTRAHHNFRRALLLNPYDPQLRFAFGQLMNEMGFPIFYLEQLRLLKQEGTASQLMLDILAREERRVIPNPAHEFGMPNGPLGLPIKIMVTRLPSQSQVDRFNSDGLFQRTFTEDMQRFSRFETIDVGVSDSVSEAWRTARTSNMDFFVIIRFVENNRQLFMESSLYLASTGALIQTNSVRRAGITRISDAITALTDSLHNLIPVKATLVRRSGQKALISAGHLNGVSLGDVFVVVESNNNRFVAFKPYFEIIGVNNLGQLTVDQVGDYASRGILTSHVRPDIMAAEDAVFLIRDIAYMPQAAQPLLGVSNGFFLVH